MKKRTGTRLSKRQQDLIKKRKRKKRRMRVVLFLEIFLLILLGTVAWGMLKLGKLNLTALDQDNLANNGFKQEGYTNIALFGTDNRDGETEGVRSDCIIVASIEHETKQVRLLSVYRDTLLKQDSGDYDKANAAYAVGGAEAGISMLNRNLDMDITDFVGVNFLALADVVDLLGGITIDMTYEEVCHMNNYSIETSEITEKEYTPINPEAAGTYTLDGVQAVSYARIRYTDGGDFERTNRQRVVIEKIAEEAKKAKVSTLNKIINKVFPEISTSFSPSEIIGMAAGMLDYSIGENAGFPFQLEMPEYIPGYEGAYVVAAGLVENVRQAHELLLPTQSYEPSNTVMEISDEISYITGIYAEDEVIGQQEYEGIGDQENSEQEY